MATKRDLSRFTVENEFWRRQRKRIPWMQRLRLIEEEFPGAVEMDANVMLRDGDVLARVIRDILKVDQIEPGRAGPRPNLDVDRGMQTWREMTGQDFSERPFPQAFQSLTNGQSFTGIARRIGQGRTRTYELWNGITPPTVDDMRIIANAYGKKPAYFAEYRAEFVLAHIAARLATETEMTIAIYTRLVRS
ncbi:hypothetical protein [Caudovirales GX15bay]|nr:hypothetical protein [Caudovirales GX15bay]